MAVSRLTFAIGDLMSEIRSLLPRDGELVAELRLSWAAYARVKAEIGHHYGKQAVASPLDGGGEQFKIGGLVVSTAPEGVDA